VLQETLLLTGGRQTHGIELGGSEAERLKGGKTFPWDDFGDFCAGTERVSGGSLQRGDDKKECGE
jgi:hypothetical protein